MVDVSAQRKGELLELKAELHGDKKERRKNALKKVILHMSSGRDVSSLFADVVNCLQTDKMDIKKLVYLYLMNYARSHPETTLLAVNTFVKDCEDQNPLIRALAIRTMGCIKSESIAEHLCVPLKRCLQDEDPYVRKTAVVCVAKFHSTSPEMVENQGFIEVLNGLLSDGNPMVISNTVASLSEIALRSPDPQKIFELNSITVSKLLTSLGECTEWGQTFILDSMSSYVPVSSNEAKNICERVTSRLSHSNSAIILSTCKVLLNLSKYVDNYEEFNVTLLKKISPPLITLLSSEPEIQYVALRNMNLISQKYPNLMKNDIRAFFVKYNDPIYVKLEKLGMLNTLVDDQNVNIVLAELKEYSSEVDVDFVRTSVRSIGRCALKVEIAADSCVRILVSLIESKVNYVVQESVIVMKDIIRRYPKRYESVIENISGAADTIDEPEARAALIWILGEFSKNISNVGEVLKIFFDGFYDESTTVQLQLLTAVVKLFLQNPRENKDLVQEMLTMVTHGCSNPDVRDRGYIYWRLLMSDPNAAKEIVLSEKPLVSEQTTKLNESLLDELIRNLSTLSSIYHKTPHAFIQGNVKFINPFMKRNDNSQPASSSTAAAINTNQKSQTAAVVGDDLLLDLSEPAFESTNQASSGVTQNQTTSSYGDLVDIISDFTIDNNMNQFQFMSSGTGDMIQQQSFYSTPKTVYLQSQAGRGLEIMGSISMRSGIAFMDLTLANQSLGVLSNFNIMINANKFGVSVSPGSVFPNVIQQQQSADVSIPLNFDGPRQEVPVSSVNILPVSLNTNSGVLNFGCYFPLYLCLIKERMTVMDENMFKNTWSNFPSSQNMEKVTVCKYFGSNLESRLLTHFIFLAHHDNSPEIEKVYCFAAFTTGEGALIQGHANQFSNQIKLTAKCTNPDLVPVVLTMVSDVLG